MKTPTFPTFPVAKIDFDALFALQKANVETMMQAQHVLIEAVQAASKAQYGWLQESLESVQAVMTGKFDTEKKPDAYLADVKAAAEKFVVVAQTQMDLGMKAQAEAMDLLTKRATANVDEVQKVAA
ncbi:MAG: hypothetical protein EA356_13300 [Geminicoccaceae bacterium]|nr:MAG: hypothetical protein EA356_13300 [Geminicoccaceae bacterium]